VLAKGAGRSVRRAAEALVEAARRVARRQQAAPTRRLVAGAAAAGLALAAVAVALTGPWDAGQRAAERRAAAAYDRDGSDTGGLTEEVAGTVPAAQQILTPLTPGDSGENPPPGENALARALAPSLDDPSLGSGATASVVDIATGSQLYGDAARTPTTPASTVKLVTAVAALDTLGPGHRLTTTALWDAGRGRVVLVGGGDTTLRSADLRALAERTAVALADADVTRAGLAYDVSLYPAQRHPIGINDNIAPITPLQVDAGRLDDSEHGPALRSTDPAGDAAAEFARYLAEAGLRVTGDPARSTAPGDAERLAVHRSGPLSSLVEEMLTNSDNDLAEALARHAAIGAGREGDFAGVTRSFTAELRELGLPRDGVRIADGSGLDREGKVTAELLTETLALAAEPGHPELRATLTGLPVAGFTGTLADRYDPDGGLPAGEGAGLVRAKTGTLTGVNSLAGTAITPDGRMLVFAFLADDTVNAIEAQTALDTAAAALASCACR
jgi:serine-type D-Ala-D-Ala carboxypeptidase/endopeptidase (penicillin-binding protein 4)